MLYLIEITWQRRDPQPEETNVGTTVQAEFARSLNRAISKAKIKFLRHSGMHRSITGVSEKPQTTSV